MRAINLSSQGIGAAGARQLVRQTKTLPPLERSRGYENTSYVVEEGTLMQRQKCRLGAVLLSFSRCVVKSEPCLW